MQIFVDFGQSFNPQCQEQVLPHQEQVLQHRTVQVLLETVPSYSPPPLSSPSSSCCKPAVLIIIVNFSTSSPRPSSSCCDYSCISLSTLSSCDSCQSSADFRFRSCCRSCFLSDVRAVGFTDPYQKLSRTNFNNSQIMNVSCVISLHDCDALVI